MNDNKNCNIETVSFPLFNVKMSETENAAIFTASIKMRMTGAFESNEWNRRCVDLSFSEKKRKKKKRKETNEGVGSMHCNMCV